MLNNVKIKVYIKEIVVVYSNATVAFLIYDYRFHSRIK